MRARVRARRSTRLLGSACLPRSWLRAPTSCRRLAWRHRQRRSAATARRRSIFGFDDRARAVVVQPDGKIVVAGSIEVDRRHSSGVWQRLRGRPLQPGRLPRHDVQRRRQGVDQLRRRRLRTGRRPADRRQDRRRWLHGCQRVRTTSPSPDSPSTVRSTRPSSATARMTITFGTRTTGRPASPSRTMAESSSPAGLRGWQSECALRRCPLSRPATSMRPSTPTGFQRFAFGGVDYANAVAIDAEGRIVVAGSSRHLGTFSRHGASPA